MSSSSCYDDSPTELSEESDVEMQEEDSGDNETIVITHSKVVARRFELWHDKFLSYREILDYLIKLGELYKPKISIERLGYSKGQRPICLVKITSGKFSRPSMSIMVEAGSNGSEKMTVSTALYLIEYLVKNDLNLLVEYLIIPCLNPDAYDRCLRLKRKPKKELHDIDLTKQFPKSLQQINPPGGIPKVLTSPPEISPNCYVLMKAIDKHKLSVKLFISLQASESSLTYPLDNYFKEVSEFALASKKAMGWDVLDVKPIVPSIADKNGTSVEHVVRNYHHCIKFAYILNVHNKCFMADEKFILAKGDQTLSGILTLSKRVYRYYSKEKCGRYQVKTVVKLLESNTE